ncbi:MAG: hypothetical protein WA418_07130 [Bradyrhizobium sp.]
MDEAGSAMDDLLQLQQPLKEGGIRSVNFFNGRLLAGKDLSREQTARREADWRLGLALGQGVAFGLQVEFDAQLSKATLPVARVKAGLAFNRRGQALRLTDNAHVALARRFETASANRLFSNCTVLGGGTYVAGAGAYLLTIAPAEMSEGRAPTNGLDPANVRCNTDATVEAVQFRLLWVNPSAYLGLDVAAPSFRNELAYRCFGVGVQPSWFENLLGAAVRQDDLLEALRKTVLSDLDVPLALLVFTGAADVRFIDLWAVRRPLARADANGALASLLDTRRLAVGQAMFLQFQEQIAGLAPPAGDLGGVTARSHFRYLPPAGVIPVAEETDATDAAATKFFKDMTYRGPAFINAARLEGLLRESLCYPPIDTQDAEMVWLYRVRENRKAIDFAGGAARPRSYLVFASGHLPYRGDAQFDLASWNYGNFALAR